MFRRTRDFFRLYWQLRKDPRVPAVSKWLPWVALVYLISPIDIVPDVIPILGQLDDIGIIFALILMAVNAISDSTWKEHTKHPKYNNVIDVTPKDEYKTQD